MFPVTLGQAAIPGNFGSRKPVKNRCSAVTVGQPMTYCIKKDISIAVFCRADRSNDTVIQFTFGLNPYLQLTTEKRKVKPLFSISPWISLALIRLRDLLTGLADPTDNLRFGWGQPNNAVRPVANLIRRL